MEKLFFPKAKLEMNNFTDLREVFVITNISLQDVHDSLKCFLVNILSEMFMFNDNLLKEDYEAIFVETEVC